MRAAGALAAFVVLSALFLAFVAHYSINVLSTDDWVTVPLVHAALHGQLTWSAMWAQHYENRMLVPNAVFVALGVLTRENVQVVMIVNAAIFIATFALFLLILRAYLSRPLSAVGCHRTWSRVVQLR